MPFVARFDKQPSTAYAVHPANQLLNHNTWQHELSDGSTITTSHHEVGCRLTDSVNGGRTIQLNHHEHGSWGHFCSANLFVSTSEQLQLIGFNSTGCVM